MNAADYAIAYRKRGWFPIPIPPRSKIPPVKDWPTLRLTEEEIPKYFLGLMNIGILTGSVSKNTVDVDLDSQSAIRLAPRFLPTTSMFGRPSKPLSHWIYDAFGVRTEIFSTPTKLWGQKEIGGEKIKAVTLLELRADGKQTVFPPGIHESGEDIEWNSEFDPKLAIIKAEDLRKRVAGLAAACLLVEFGWDDAEAVAFTINPDPNAIKALAPEVQNLLARWLGPAAAVVVTKPAKRPNNDPFQDAVNRWNEQNPLVFEKRNTGPCPVCEDQKSFGQLRENPKMWSCFSTDHPADVGIRSPGDMCAIGDALDLEAYRRKKTRAQVLREDGFLDAPGTPPPSTPPPDDSDEPPFEDVRPEIQLSTNQYDVIKLAVQALTLCKNTYQRGNQLVRIVSSETPPAFVSFTQPAPLIKGIPAVSIGVSLTKHADIKTYNKKDKKLMGAHPPAWLTSGIEKRMEYENIRPLSGIVEIPTLRPDGTMIVVPGYDPGTGLVYKPTTTFEKIPERASLAEAKAAMDFILDLVGDFPFAGPEYRSAWAAALFTPFARPAINGPAPLFMLDSNIRGSGKSKLCDLISLIVTGRTMARMANPPHDEEFKKLITSAALAGTRQIMIDNIIGPFGSAALDAALTSTTWQDRILGHSEMTAELPLAITWYVTGNNIQIVGDLCRRTIHVRIESPDEKPEERQNFKYQDVLDHALRNRARYVSAVLTVFGAYCAAGRPQQKMRRMDYVAWSDFVRGALLYVGLPDPALTQVGLAAADSVAEGLGMFITALVAVDPNGAGLSAQDILIRASAPDQDTLREAIGAICPTRDGSLPQAQQFGMKLHTIKRRVVDGYHLDVTGKTKTRNTKTLWCARKGAPRKEGNNE